MWSRVLEIVLGIWLWMDPYIFGYSAERVEWWVNDYVAGAFCMLFGCLSYVRRLELAHLGNIAVGVWLIAYAFTNAGWPVEPVHQNAVIVGLLLLMFGVIPNEASEPPLTFRPDKQPG